MMSVFVYFAQILLRLFVKGLLATERTEVISLPFILGGASCGGGVDVHVTDRVMYGCCHKLISFVLIDYQINRHL
jgi:hypothetical protein